MMNGFRAVLGGQEGDLSTEDEARYINCRIEKILRSFIPKGWDDILEVTGDKSDI